MSSLLNHILFAILLTTKSVLSCLATSGTSPVVTTTTAPSVTTTAVTTTAVTTTTAAASACATCTTDLIGIVTGNDGDSTPTSTLGTNVAGCSTLTYTCARTPVVASDVILISFFSDSQTPPDVGTENGDGSATATLTCVDGVWQNAGIEINDIECQIIT